MIVQVLLRRPDNAPLAERLRRPTAGRMELFWLGQAGFVVRTRHTTLLIDPYLSDSLAEKYRGTLFDHVRLVPVPVTSAQLPPVDLVLCTHGHSDHLDPGTLPGLATAHPGARFVVPWAVRELAYERGAPVDRTLLARVGEPLRPLPDVTVVPLASAHETLEHDGRYLGYVLDIGGVRLYHSGDCVPYDGLAQTLAEMAVDVALLPVNGRDEHRLRHGVPGNFHWHEAVQLCADAGIPALVPHHFGMFAFNTVDPQRLDPAWAARLGVQVTVPELGAALELRISEETPA